MGIDEDDFSGLKPPAALPDGKGFVECVVASVRLNARCKYASLQVKYPIPQTQSWLSPSVENTTINSATKTDMSARSWRVYDSISGLLSEPLRGHTL